MIFMETMGNLRRTHYCGTLRARDAGTQMTVAGSIAKCRDKGGVIFADLRDTTGILQLIFDDSTDRAVFEKASGLKSEYVVIAAGTLREREAKTDKIPTGEVELFVTELRVLSGAQTTPFEVRDGINVNDQLRLKYRYLDLRRPSMHEPIVVRSKIAKVVRDYYDEQHFVEIETPMLIKSTPEGARDYLVPSRVQPGHFYALPQSPQLYKQILMLSGFDRYYQIVRCFRDEDLRADRQPEFTQIDMEMSFVTEDDVMAMNEGLVKRVFREVLGVDVETPFRRMPYSEAMARYGSDKPDTRFGLELQDVTDVLRESGFAVFKSAVEAGGSVRALAYDMVLNGCELGGGSIRINDPAVQDRMLKALGFSEERARESFGFLMDAYQYGAPPHGGMAFGFDRMVMLMLKRDSIRDVIAFPKVQNAGEPMSGCPETVEEKQLRELSIAYAPIETEE